MHVHEAFTSLSVGSRAATPRETYRDFMIIVLAVICLLLVVVGALIAVLLPRRVPRDELQRAGRDSAGSDPGETALRRTAWIRMDGGGGAI